MPEPQEPLVPFNDLKRPLSEQRQMLLQVIAGVIDSGQLVLGQKVSTFEENWSELLGVSDTVGVASGTDALVIGLASLGVKPGSVVATVANAGGYATTAAHSLGARMMFIDIDPENFLMDPEALRKTIEIQGKPDALVATHLYGNPADVVAIGKICEEYSIPWLEDCAQAAGGAVQGRALGSFATASTFSFFPTKNLGALGDGGAVATSSKELGEQVRQLRQYGWGQRYSIAINGGQNSRLDEIQASVLLERMNYLATQNLRRREIMNRYFDAIEGTDNRLVWNPSEPGTGHLAVVECADKTATMAKLEQQAIGHSIHYPVLDHHQPAWQAHYSDQLLPNSVQLNSRILSLPSFPEMTDSEIDRVCEVLGAI